MGISTAQTIAAQEMTQIHPPGAWLVWASCVKFHQNQKWTPAIAPKGAAMRGRTRLNRFRPFSWRAHIVDAQRPEKKTPVARAGNTEISHGEPQRLAFQRASKCTGTRAGHGQRAAIAASMRAITNNSKKWMRKEDRRGVFICGTGVSPVFGPIPIESWARCPCNTIILPG